MTVTITVDIDDCADDGIPHKAVMSISYGDQSRRNEWTWISTIPNAKHVNVVTDTYQRRMYDGLAFSDEEVEVRRSIPRHPSARTLPDPRSLANEIGRYIDNIFGICVAVDMAGRET